jgi:membrane protein implicated in regulation of membrane protease activity
MRRIDVIAICLAVFAAGGVLYWGFGIAGLDAADAGIWSQFVMVLGLIGWVSTYLYRAATQKMTYVQQLKDYEDAVIRQRYENLTPEQLAQLQQELAQEAQSAAPATPTDPSLTDA